MTSVNDRKKSSHVVSAVVHALDKTHGVAEANRRELEIQLQNLTEQVRAHRREKAILLSFLERVGFDGRRLIDVMEECDSEDLPKLLSILHAFRLDIDTQHPDINISEHQHTWAMERLEELLTTRKEDEPHM